MKQIKVSATGAGSLTGTYESVRSERDGCASTNFSFRTLLGANNTEVQVRIFDNESFNQSYIGFPIHLDMNAKGLYVEVEGKIQIYFSLTFLKKEN